MKDLLDLKQAQIEALQNELEKMQKALLDSRNLLSEFLEEMEKLNSQFEITLKN